MCNHNRLGAAKAASGRRDWNRHHEGISAITPSTLDMREAGGESNGQPVLLCQQRSSPADARALAKPFWNDATVSGFWFLHQSASQGLSPMLEQIYADTAGYDCGEVQDPARLLY